MKKKITEFARKLNKYMNESHCATSPSTDPGCHTVAPRGHC